MWPKKKDKPDSNGKYMMEPLNSVHLHDGSVAMLHRIVALRDIPRHGVATGDVGGYIESMFNLSEEGDAWVGGSAAILGRVKVKDNALVTDHAIVLSTAKDADPYPWVGGSSLVKDQVSVSGTDFILTGKSQALDHAILCNMKNFDSSIVKGYAKVNNSRMENNSIVSRKAKIYNNSLLLDSAVVTDNAVLYNSAVSSTSFVGGSSRVDESKIRDDTHISGRVKIKANSICEGTNRLSGDLVIPANHHVFNKTIVGSASFFGGIPDGEIPDVSNEDIKTTGENNDSMKALESNVSISSFESTVLEIEAEYKTYSTDIVKLIKYPLMADPSVPETQNFIFLLRKSKRLIGSKDESIQQDIAEQLERAYMVAEANALKVASSLYSDAERKKTTDARSFITKACDENSTESEKKIGFNATMKALEGIMVIPEEAVVAFRQKIGLLEIEA